MENGQSSRAAQGDGGFIMNPNVQREVIYGHNDIMLRRLKNRERQRRYRARKRLETDTNKSIIVQQSTPPIAELQSNGAMTNYTSRVLCKRDWKKDARRAHLLKNLDLTPGSNCLIAAPISFSESQALCLSSVEQSSQRETQSGISHDLDNGEIPRTTPGKRDWKADARKKKN